MERDWWRDYKVEEKASDTMERNVWLILVILTYLLIATVVKPKWIQSELLEIVVDRMMSSQPVLLFQKVNVSVRRAYKG